MGVIGWINKVVRLMGFSYKKKRIKFELNGCNELVILTE